MNKLCGLATNQFIPVS